MRQGSNPVNAIFWSVRLFSSSLPVQFLELARRGHKFLHPCKQWRDEKCKGLDEKGGPETDGEQENRKKRASFWPLVISATVAIGILCSKALLHLRLDPKFPKDAPQIGFLLRGSKCGAW